MAQQQAGAETNHSMGCKETTKRPNKNVFDETVKSR
jgi:hypothetical protein